MSVVRTAGLIAAFAPLALGAQRTEEFTLSGPRVAVYNVAGAVRVERGSGNAVVVEVTRGGADASRIRIVERTVDGRTALCIEYPSERIVYRSSNQRWNGSTNSTSGNPCDNRGNTWWGGRIEVSSRGNGVEAWADLRILVPRGSDLRVRHMVGSVEVRDVEATLEVDVASARVTTAGTRGMLSLDTGSGGVTVDTHRGNLSVDVGSGGISVNDVDGGSINIDTGSGGVRGTALTCGELLVDTGSGSITMSAVTARRASFDTGSGGVTLGFDARIEDLSIDSGSGTVTVSLPQDFSAQVAISTGSGGISSDFDVATRRVSRNSLRGTIGDGRGRVTIETGSGGVRLRRR